MEPEEPMDEHDAAPSHTWRHVRTAVTLLILVAFVVGAAWYSWQQVTGSPDTSGDPGSSGATCVPVAATDAPVPEDIVLNVYNATQRSGLAGDVADQMRERGFAVNDVANDPLQRNIEESAEVRAHPDQQAAAGFIGALVPGAVLVPDERDSQAVDLVLGNGFEELTAMPDPGSTLEACM